MNLLYPLALIGTGLYFATRKASAQSLPKPEPDFQPPQEPTEPTVPQEPNEPPTQPTEPTTPQLPTASTWQQVLHPSEGCMMQTGRTYRYTSQQGPHYTRMEDLAALPLGTIFPAGWTMDNWGQYEFKWAGETGYYEWPWAMFEHGEKLEVRVP